MTEFAKGFTCECGKYHEFGAYVHAHSFEELVHTCDECGRRHSVHEYDVALLSDPNVSPYLNKPTRARLEAAYDLCPELRDAVGALRWIVSDLPSRRDWLDPSLEKLARKSLSDLEKIQ